MNVNTDNSLSSFQYIAAASAASSTAVISRSYSNASTNSVAAVYSVGVQQQPQHMSTSPLQEVELPGQLNSQEIVVEHSESGAHDEDRTPSQPYEEPPQTKNATNTSENAVEKYCKNALKNSSSADAIRVYVPFFIDSQYTKNLIFLLHEYCERIWCPPEESFEYARYVTLCKTLGCKCYANEMRKGAAGLPEKLALIPPEHRLACIQAIAEAATPPQFQELDRKAIVDFLTCLDEIHKTKLPSEHVQQPITSLQHNGAHCCVML